MKSETTSCIELSGYRVSKNTGAFIDAIEALNAAYGVIYDAFNLMYSNHADHLMDEDIYPVFEKLKDEVEAHLLTSISENLGDKENQKEII